jgi:hypothetical protein
MSACKWFGRRPPAAGAYEQPGMDLRIKKRNAFAIALLLCPR